MQFSGSTTAVNFPVVPANYPMQVDISSPSEMEAIREICFLGGLKAGGPDGLSLSFKNSGGDKAEPTVPT